jgi:hypothetical protein
LVRPKATQVGMLSRTERSEVRIEACGLTTGFDIVGHYVAPTGWVVRASGVMSRTLGAVWYNRGEGRESIPVGAPAVCGLTGQGECTNDAL